MRVPVMAQSHAGFPLFPSGVTEIRTREPLVTVTRFPGVPLQPLEHHSVLLFLRCKDNVFFLKIEKMLLILWQ